MIIGYVIITKTEEALPVEFCCVDVSLTVIVFSIFYLALE